MLSSDARVSPGWLSRLLYHAEVDAKSGCIGPVSDRADHGQQVLFALGGDSESIAAFDRDRAASQHRAHTYSALLTPFCQLFRREVVAAIGGFDERFGHGGLEHDDFTLRAGLAGFRNRIALDVFVHRGAGGAESADRDWDRFCHKWGLPAHAARGEGQHLAEVMRRPWTVEELRISAESPLNQTAPALPRWAADAQRAGQWNA